ncbi:MAG: hypothetical protein IJE97_15455, partial [Thermoguttaceae bacterium]|nr:hypothetical protein [Thermoguttaceae bacterium]
LFHPIPEKIVELRRLTKLRGTYLEPLPTQALPSTGRVCATFNQAATATGRLSSSEPNLQNIPARSENGKIIRAGFVPDASLGFDAFVSCDYSQIELRVLAHFSGDPELRRAFADGEDVHALVASRLFGVAQADVTPDMRRKAKAVNFGLVYGQTSFGLSKAINVSASEAAAYIDAFFATYPGVLTFFDRVLDDCARRGFVQTLLGRRRALSGVRGARGRKTLNFPERAAINAVVQGTAADLMKLAMLAVWRRLKKRRLDRVPLERRVCRRARFHQVYPNHRNRPNRPNRRNRSNRVDSPDAANRRAIPFRRSRRFRRRANRVKRRRRESRRRFAA